MFRYRTIVLICIVGTTQHEPGLIGRNSRPAKLIDQEHLFAPFGIILASLSSMWASLRAA